jgi:hypothetical protein
MRAWAWRLFIGEFRFDEINWFCTSSKAEVSVLFFIVFMLDISFNTAPGPGTFWI